MRLAVLGLTADAERFTLLKKKILGLYQRNTLNERSDWAKIMFSSDL